MLLFIYSGVISTGITLSGYMHIESGGTANSTTVNSGGDMWIANGGTANSTTVNSGGDMYISSGGTATEIKENGGYVYVAAGANVTFASNTISGRKLSNAIMTVHSNTIAHSTTVNSGGWMHISSGGTANSTTVNSSGWMWIYSGGTANSTTVNDGYMHIESGGTANSTTVNSGGCMRISSGGVANSTTVNSSGWMHISSGGVANSTTVNSGGHMWIESGGVANSTTANSGGDMWIHSGGTANSTTVNSGVEIMITNGGTATEIKENGGYVYVADGANVTFASNTISGFTLSNARMTVHSNTIAHSTTVNSGGTMYISNGGIHRGSLQIESGAVVYAYSGNIIDFTVSERTASDGYLVNDLSRIHGTPTYTITVSAEQSAGVYKLAQGAANFTGSISIGDGSVNYGLITVNGDAIVYNDVAYKLTQSAGNLTLSISNAGDNETIISGVIVNQGSSLHVSDGMIANNTTVNSGGWMYISSGGTANSTTVNSGRMYIESGGTANSTTVNSGGWMQISSGGTVNSTTVNSSGDMRISSGGTANSTTVNAGRMDIKSGGTATEIKENGGDVNVEDGANVTFASNTISGFILTGNAMTVHSNTIAHSTTVNDGGWIKISSGGTANSTTVNSGGWMHISSGGTANSTTVNSGGDMWIYSGGTANSTTVNSGGYMWISSGGTANSTTVNSGGAMYISNGGTANSTTVNSGGSMRISSDGILRGSLQIESGAVVNAYFGNIIDFTVSERTASDGYLVNDLSRIHGTPTYTITVSAEQSAGVYKLAQGAANFTGSISIGDGSVSYGTLSVNGNAFRYNGVSYQLTLFDGNLHLSVIDAVPELTGDKNGVSFTNISGEAKVEFSKDSFASVLQITPAADAVDTYGMPAGTYQWQVCADGTCYQGENIISNSDSVSQILYSDADGDMDVFFANANSKWEAGYAAEHQGSLNGWTGTKEQVILEGKNKIADVFTGSGDANVLVLTDDTSGDALFIDDIYTALGYQSRLSQIKEIRAGAGDDIIDLTSQRYAYIGKNMTVYGGSGDDTIWANNGSNTLFGDAGNDRIIGGSADDMIIGGIGDDSLHGGGGNDTFCFGANFGNDTIEQLAGGSVTLHFETGSDANWNADTLTYTDGANSVTVSGVTDVTLVFGGTAPGAGVFADCASEKIFEDKNKGMIA